MLGRACLLKVSWSASQMCCLPSSIEVTVEDDTSLDLSEFRVDEHAGVLLDGFADVLTLKMNREVLQGRPKVCRRGRSTTMMYACPFALARRAVVAKMDLSARNLHLLRTDHWLSDGRSIVQVWLQHPAWVSEGSDVNINVLQPQTLGHPRKSIFWCRRLRIPWRLRVTGFMNAMQGLLSP